LDAYCTNRSLSQCLTLRHGGWLLWPDEPVGRIRRQPEAVLRATLKCGIFASTSRLASRVVHWTLFARIGASYSAPLCGKDAGCCGQMSLQSVSNACQEQAPILVLGLETSEETQIGAFIACTDPLLRASALLLSCAILPLNPQNDFFPNSETIFTP